MSFPLCLLWWSWAAGEEQERVPGVIWLHRSQPPTWLHCQPGQPLRGRGHSRVPNSLWIIHECTPPLLTVTGKSQIEFFSSPEKNTIDIPGVRHTHHLAFLTWAGGYLEATWNLLAWIRFPPTHCTLVNEIQELRGAQNYLMVWGNCKGVSIVFNPSYCCPAFPAPSPWSSNLSWSLVFLKAFAHITLCLMPYDSVLLTALPQSLMHPSYIRYASSNLCIKIVKIVIFGNN